MAKDQGLVTIEPEFEKLCPPLQKDEYDQLEKNIVADGCREPLICWNFILVDGHNRFKICKKNGIDFEITHKNFVDDNDARDWIINNQLGRRNITAEQRRYLVGRLFRQKQQADKLAAIESVECGLEQNVPEKHSGKQGKSNGTAKKGGGKNDSRTVADAARVSHTQVLRAARYSEAVDSLKNGVRTAVLGRAVKSTDADVRALAKLPEDQQKKIVAKAQESGKRVGEFLPAKPKANKKHLKFDDSELLEHWKQLTQLLDKRFRAYEDVKDSKTYHTAVMHNLRVARDNFDEWRKRTS